MSKQDFLESRNLKAHNQVKRVLWTSMFGVRMIAEIKGNKVFISVY